MVAPVLGAAHCDVPLRIVKSFEESTGNQDAYVAWRQSATDTYELFEPYPWSRVHYQGVIIIRNNIKGPARNCETER